MFHITEACKTFKLIPYVTANPAMPVEYKAISVSSDLFYEIEPLNTLHYHYISKRKREKKLLINLTFLRNMTLVDNMLFPSLDPTCAPHNNIKINSF